MFRHWAWHQLARGRPAEHDWNSRPISCGDSTWEAVREAEGVPGPGQACVQGERVRRIIRRRASGPRFDSGSAGQSRGEELESLLKQSPRGPALPHGSALRFWTASVSGAWPPNRKHESACFEKAVCVQEGKRAAPSSRHAAGRVNHSTQYYVDASSIHYLT